MSRAEVNKRYYDKTQRKVHSGKFVPMCRQPGVVAKPGETVTCGSCLRIAKQSQVGKHINEWDQKRLDALFRARNAAMSREWRRRNPEKASASSRKWRTNNPDLHRLALREWRSKNREYYNAYNRARWHANKANQASA